MGSMEIVNSRLSTTWMRTTIEKASGSWAGVAHGWLFHQLKMSSLQMLTHVNLANIVVVWVGSISRHAVGADNVSIEEARLQKVTARRTANQNAVEAEIIDSVSIEEARLRTIRSFSTK